MSAAVIPLARTGRCPTKLHRTWLARMVHRQITGVITSLERWSVLCRVRYPLQMGLALVRQLAGRGLVNRTSAKTLRPASRPMPRSFPDQGGNSREAD